MPDPSYQQTSNTTKTPKMSFAREKWHKITLFVVIIILLGHGFSHFRPFRTVTRPFKHSSFDDWCQLQATNSSCNKQRLSEPVFGSNNRSVTQAIS